VKPTEQILDFLHLLAAAAAAALRAAFGLSNAARCAAFISQYQNKRSIGLEHAMTIVVWSE
jgi:hypothetical protein